MAGLRRIEIARLAGTSPAAVTLAIRSGALRVGPDDRLDPDNPLNAQWIYMHQCGADTRGRLWRWPKSELNATPAVSAARAKRSTRLAAAQRARQPGNGEGWT